MQLRFALSAMAAGLLGPLAISQSPDAIEDVFPSSSFGFVQFGGLKACVGAAEELGLVKLARASIDEAGPEVFEQLIGRELRKELPKIHRELERVGLPPAMVRAVLQNPIALGLGRPTFFGGMPVPSVTLAVDVADHDDEARQLIGLIEAWVSNAGPGVERDQSTEHGTAITALQHPRRSGAVVHARMGRYLLVSNCKGYLRECLATCRGDVASYGQTPAYQASRQQLPARALVSGHLSLQPLWFAGPFLPYEVTDVLDALGITALDGVSFALTTDGNASLGIAHIGIKGPESGLLRSVLGRPASFAAAALCPDDTLFYATASLDPNAAMASLDRVLDALPPEISSDLRRTLVREIQNELRPAGMTLDDLQGLVGLFGPELTIAVTSPGGSTLQPEVTIMLDVANPDAARNVVASALREAGAPEGKETSYKETPIRYWDAFKGTPVPYRPALAIADGKLIVGSSARTVKSTLARMTAKRAGLDGVEDFVRSTAAARGASVFATVRLNSAVPKLWGMAVPFLEKGLEQLGDIDPDVLPTREQLTEAVSDSIMTLTLDAEGLTLRDQQVLGLGGMIAIAGLLVDRALALPASGREKPRGKIY